MNRTVLTVHVHWVSDRTFLFTNTWHKSKKKKYRNLHWKWTIFIKCAVVDYTLSNIDLQTMNFGRKIRLTPAQIFLSAKSVKEFWKEEQIRPLNLLGKMTYPIHDQIQYRVPVNFSCLWNGVNVFQRISGTSHIPKNPNYLSDLLQNVFIHLQN